MKNAFLLFTVLLLWTTAGLSAQVTVTSSFDPPVITAGEPSLYRINFSSEGRSSSFYNSAPPQIPNVEGLRFQYIGPSHETRIVNGRASVRTSHLFRATASEPGTYEVPAFSFESRSFSAEIPAATLQVLDRGASTTPDGTASTRTAWLDVGLPRENLYVGETTPTGIRLFLNSQQITDASLAAEHPEKIGDAFSIGEFGSMSQSQIALDGLPVTVADWTVLLTPLKTGAQPLLFELPLSVNLRNSNRRNDPFESFFRGGSPFSRMFDRETIRAYSEDREIEILPLPTANQPEDFTGGIGRFQVEQTQISSTSVQVGEPFLFTVEISGQGNFDRLEAPVLLSESERWRTYDPESSFTPRDNLGYAGVKSFTYTLIPREEGLKTTPEFTFSFFAPEAAEYQTVTVPPTNIEVRPAPPGSATPRRNSEAANPVEARRGPDLLPLATDWSGGKPAGLRPVYTSTFFIIVQILLLILLTVSYLILRHRLRLREDPDYARRNRARRASRRYRIQASTHAAAGRSEQFIHSACRALQESVGPFQRGEPGSLTENNVTRILAEQGYSTEVLEEVHHFFAAEEACQYGGRSMIASDLQKDNQRLLALLKVLHSGKTKSSRIPPSAAANLLVFLLVLAVAAPGIALGQEAADPYPAANSSVPASTITPATNSKEARATFDEALASYDDKDFSKAAKGFRSLLENYSSWNTHYNLANSLYQLREYPEAILQYEKAFALDPTNPDIQTNLDLTREAASIEPPPEAALSWIGHRLTWSSWTWLLALGFWGLVSTLLLSQPSKLPALWRNLLVLIFGLILTSSILAQITWISTADRAIVMTNDTPLRISPTASSPLETRITAGVSVTAEEAYGDYQRVRLEDGTVGWVLRSSIESIRETSQSSEDY